MKNISEVAKYLLKEQGIKVSTVYVNDFKYDDKWVFLPRIYSYRHNKAKFRILTNEQDKVKNCLKITFDLDRVTRQEVVNKINRIKHLIPYHINGTCQMHLTVRSLEQLLTCYEPNNSIKKEVKELIH